MVNRLTKKIGLSAIASTILLGSFTGCGSGGGNSSATQETIRKTYGFKFLINADGDVVSTLSPVETKELKALPSGFKLTNKNIADQNISVSFSEISETKTKFIVSKELSSNFDTNTGLYYHYLNDENYINADETQEVNFSKPLKIVVSFDYNDSKEDRFEGVYKTDANAFINNTPTTLSFNMAKLNATEKFQVATIENNLSKTLNKVFVDITIDNLFKARDVKNVDEIPSYKLVALNDNAKVLIKYFDDYNKSSDKNDSYFTGKIATIEELKTASELNLRFNIDKSRMSEWLNGVSKFQFISENSIRNFDVRVNGRDVGVELLFSPYIENFTDLTDSNLENVHKISVIANDPDGENSALTYRFASNDFTIEQNGSAEATLFGNKGLFTIIAKDNDGLESKEVKLVIGSFVSINACINNNLGLTESETPTNEQLLSIKELSCIGSAIETLAGVEKLTNLETLDLSDNRIKDLTPLANLKSLKKLQINHNLIENLTPLANLKSLVELDARDNQIKDISPILTITMLSSLNLENNELSALGVLQTNIERFSYLNLNGNYFSDEEIKLYGSYNNVKMEDSTMREFDIVANKPLITLIRKKLNLASDQDPTEQQYDSITGLSIPADIKDIDGIKKLRNLQYIYFDSSGVSDFSELTELTKLTELRVYNGYSSSDMNFSTIPEITSLQSLSISGSHSRLTNIDAISKMTKLKRLELQDYSWSNSQITKLPDLSQLTSLEYFYTYGFQNLKDISGLSKVTSLKNVYLYYTSISDLSPLEKSSGLTSLTIRYLNDSTLPSLQSVGKLLALQSLGLHDIAVQDMSPLSNLKNLTSLSLSSMSGIKDLSFVKSPNLNYISLNSLSNLTDVSALADFNSLYNVHISSSAISKLPTFSTTSDLKNIYISYNNSLTDISGLATAKKLTYLNYKNVNNNFATIKNQISKLTTVKSLDIRDYSSSSTVTDTNWLDGLTLNSFSLNSYKVSNLDGIGRQTALINLDLSNGGYSTLTDFSPVSKLVNLTSLYLQNIHGVTDFSPVSSLTKLGYLYAYNNNGLKTLPSFEKSKASMYRVYVYNNSNLENISSLSTFANNDNWKYIYVANSPKIKSVPDLSAISKISTLCLRDNNISDISNLHKFNYKINDLNLQYNRISDENLSALQKDFTERNILPNGFYISNQKK
jgi:Leucine-rich repeat (LRR) protein